MRRIGYSSLLIVLRGLIYAKRALVWLFLRCSRAFAFGAHFLYRTIGFRFYKLGFLAQKTLGRARIPWDSRIIEFIGKRSTLQAVLFVVSILVMVPHSRLYTRGAEEISGRGTALYALIGPGDEEFAIEEVFADEPAFAEGDIPAWREGAVGSPAPGAAGDAEPRTIQEIAGISAGGSALTKPTILPGAPLPAPDGSLQPARTAVESYIVEPGDVIGKIAEHYGVSVETILWENNLSERSLIRPGDSLKILPVDGVEHTVKAGDTVSKIAKAYGSDQEKIVAFNKLQKDGSDIVVGETLIVPGGRKQSPRPPAIASAPARFRGVAAPPASVEAPAGSGYLWPTSVRRITQYFNWRHTGLDIAGPFGTPVYASRAGTVVKSQCGWSGGYGCHIVIDHGDGVKTLYAHNSENYAGVGDSVAQGQTIAVMGSTGRSTGPHVHFEVWVKNVKQNPLKYVR